MKCLLLPLRELAQLSFTACTRFSVYHDIAVLYNELQVDFQMS